MSNTNVGSGWNRQKNGEEAKMGKRTQKPQWLRGVLAGLCVIALGGAVVWFMFGQEGERTDAKSKLRKPIESVEPAKPKVKNDKSKEIASHKPSLPVPKISKERIEQREAIPAPQPLEEMQAALTNKPPKKKVAFSNGAEQLIAMATPSQPGAYVPPLPDITNESVARDVEKALKNTIKAEEGDDIALLEKKVVVAEAKEEFRELRDKEGWGFAEYVNALRDQANADAEFLAEAHKVVEEIYHDKTIPDEDYVKYRDQVNEKLRERGLPEIDTEEEQPE